MGRLVGCWWMKCRSWVIMERWEWGWNCSAGFIVVPDINWIQFCNLKCFVLQMHLIYRRCKIYRINECIYVYYKMNIIKEIKKKIKGQSARLHLFYFYNFFCILINLFFVFFVIEYRRCEIYKHNVCMFIAKSIFRGKEIKKKIKEQSAHLNSFY